ncbi:hypothetical protein Lal_00037403 [Lupinus albus]|uniref:Uncharacterized protein n=1 Tax=Lupinus albus TaxID=3870 RepID=A0A6A5P0R5_LUPAL|nr:hypothetical protein Lalb_Chr18g0056301 [Lupinus albus]KAF1890833.1 hypothetical protein Lal_00037403 [Lupinus albus]
MALSRRSYSYSKMDKEDPEDVMRRRTQFLIYKVLEQANSPKKQSCLRIRISKLKVKIGNKLRRLRKKINASVCAVRVCFHGHATTQLKIWKRLFGKGRQTLKNLPPMIK